MPTPLPTPPLPSPTPTPTPTPTPSPSPPERDVVDALQRLRFESRSHSPSVTQIEHAVPGLVQVDACFLSNPYATSEVMTRFRSIPDARLERMVGHYPSQAPALAEALAPHLGVPVRSLHLANGACEVIHALLDSAPGSVLLNLPTFSAYYEFANSVVLVNQLDARQDFRVDLDKLEQMVHRHRPHTVVIINPNNPDGGLIPHPDLVAWLERVHDRVPQIIVDESFSHFTTEDPPPTLAGLVEELPHLVVVNSLSKNYGIAGLRLGYAVMSAKRARALRGNSLWNLNAFAEWFTTLLGDPMFQQAYERARLRYLSDIRTFFADLTTLPGITVHPSVANFALLHLKRPADQVTGALLARHGVYVRDCADKRGLACGQQYIRVAARTRPENRRILDSLLDVLSEPAVVPRTASPPVRPAQVPSAGHTRGEVGP